MGIEPDEAADDDLYNYALTRDDFGVPSNLMGSHPEPFFSMLGRIVALSATLEYKVLAFYQSLAGRDQNAFTELSISRVIAGAREELPRLTAPAERQMASDYLDEAQVIARRRNDYVHNLWPAQPGGRTFGWRRPRLKTRQAGSSSRGRSRRCRRTLTASSHSSKSPTSNGSTASCRQVSTSKLVVEEAER